MNEELVERFVKSLHESTVKDNLELYKDMYKTTEINSQTDEAGIRAIKFFNELTEYQKGILYEIFEQIMIDTVSTVLGIIDGHVTQVDDTLEPKLLLNSKETEGLLQDFYLAYTEELEEKK